MARGSVTTRHHLFPTSRYNPNGMIVNIDDPTHKAFHSLFRNLNTHDETLKFLFRMNRKNTINKQFVNMLISEILSEDGKRTIIEIPCLLCNDFPLILNLHDIHDSILPTLKGNTRSQWEEIFGEDINTPYQAILYLREIYLNRMRIWTEEKLTELGKSCVKASKTKVDKDDFKCYGCPGFETIERLLIKDTP